MRVLACVGAGTIDYDMRCLPLSAALERDEELREWPGWRDRANAWRSATMTFSGAPRSFMRTCDAHRPRREPIDSTRQPGPQRVRIQTSDGVTL
jgi:hypothetical protein